MLLDDKLNELYGQEFAEKAKVIAQRLARTHEIWRSDGEKYTPVEGHSYKLREELSVFMLMRVRRSLQPYGDTREWNAMPSWMRWVVDGALGNVRWDALAASYINDAIYAIDWTGIKDDWQEGHNV